MTLVLGFNLLADGLRELSTDGVSTMAPPLLSVENLRVEYHGGAGAVTAIPDLSFALSGGRELRHRRRVGLREVDPADGADAPPRPDRADCRRSSSCSTAVDLATASRRELGAVRGRGLAMVYQDPNAALNPTMTIGAQLAEVPMLDPAGRA